MYCRPSPERLALALLIGLVSPQTVHAHRPYDVIDASVADVRTLESEFGLRHRTRAEPYGNALPFAFTFGIDGLTEAGFGARIHASDGRRRTHDLAFTVKRVIRRGSMQDAGGASIAAECGAPVPALRSDGAGGAFCALAASHRTAAADVHINAGASRGGDGRAIRVLGAAIEGPGKWAVRPLAEVSSERASGQPGTIASLLGLSWQARTDLSFGLALRRSHAAGERSRELRFGLMWTAGG